MVPIFAEHSSALPNSPYVVSPQSGDDLPADRSASELLRGRRLDHLQPLDKTRNGPPGANRNAARAKFALDTSPSKRGAGLAPALFAAGGGKPLAYMFKLPVRCVNIYL